MTATPPPFTLCEPDIVAQLPALAGWAEPRP